MQFKIIRPEHPNKLATSHHITHRPNPPNGAAPVAARA